MLRIEKSGWELKANGEDLGIFQADIGGLQYLDDIAIVTLEYYADDPPDSNILCVTKAGIKWEIEPCPETDDSGDPLHYGGVRIEDGEVWAYSPNNVRHYRIDLDTGTIVDTRPWK